jgi:hypothetical protein
MASTITPEPVSLGVVASNDLFMLMSSIASSIQLGSDLGGGRDEASGLLVEVA